MTPQAVLVVAAHPDDEVLGCGGTIARWAAQGCPVHVLLLADGEGARAPDGGVGASDERLQARAAAARGAAAILGCSTLELLDYPDNRLDGVELLDLVRHVEVRIAQFEPATILTHHAGDVNIDHRVVHDAVIAACRPVPGGCVGELLFFEVPSSTEWRPAASAVSFCPDWFVDISATLPKKLDALQAYREELRAFPHPRSLQAVRALAQWRGATAGVDAAEAFVLGRKIVR
jgi:LmbE family N-acetylglucosaminyl deacetylase